MGVETGVLEVAVAIVLLAAGALIGRWMSRRDSPLRARIEELEALLFEERERRSAYEAAVGKHFEQTSELFRDLTHQYTTLYAHLAEGSRELCGDRQLPPGRGFDAPGLSPSELSQPAEPAPEEGLATEDPSRDGP
jgi:uncharacterized membrane-anchored protein YhcB (DUF1043 family)